MPIPADKRMNTEKTKKRGFSRIREYCPLPALIIFALTLAAAVSHLVMRFSVGFSDFFCAYVSPVLRLILSSLTGLLPFSLAETVLIFLPYGLAAFLIYAFRSEKLRSSETADWRFFFSSLALCGLLYSLFVFSFAAGYSGSTLDERLDIKGYTESVSAERLTETAELLAAEASELSREVLYSSSGASVMPYSLDEMKTKLAEAYRSAAEKYDFIPRMPAKVKQIVLSRPMTYTHISGVYTYFTGEANINTNFPDYTLPYTAAHEMSHQRGIAREEEANFMAYLVCMESDDPYVRYSGCESLLEYVMDALYTADSDAYLRVYYTALNGNLRRELSAYSEFFRPYSESLASAVSGTINDTFLKTQGQKAGSQSYGLVVNLAVAYCLGEETGQAE